MSQNSTTSQNTNNNQPQQKNVKDMTLEEQVNYYKTKFQKSRTLSKMLDTQMKQLKEKLANYECQEGEECDLIMKFKYDKDIFYLFKDSKKKFFLNENTLDKELIEQLKKFPSIKLYDYDKDLKNKDNYLTQIINQYEEKIKKLTKENEDMQNKLKEIQLKQNQINEEKLRIENIIKNILEKSNEINIQLKNIFDMDNISNDESVIKEIYSKIKENINNLKLADDMNNTNQNNNDNNNINIWLNELNNFIILLLNELQDNIFKILEREKEDTQEKNKYQKTIDEILLNHQDEKNKLFIELEGDRNKMKNLYAKIAELEKEKYDISKDKETSIQRLNKQINSGVNLNYLKNIMISFLSSNDKNIQEGLLPVIYKSLDFNQSEIKVVHENRNKSSGFFSYFRNNYFKDLEILYYKKNYIINLKF